MRTTLIEPTITEMLNDPIVGLLMEHDGVSVEDLQQLLGETRCRLNGGQNWSKPGGSVADSQSDVMALAEVGGPGRRSGLPRPTATGQRRLVEKLIDVGRPVEPACR